MGAGEMAGLGACGRGRRMPDGGREEASGEGVGWTATPRGGGVEVPLLVAGGGGRVDYSSSEEESEGRRRASP
uniref:Uncharacterized protein n=1 Tax=Arundo donax TaxID=35708 RepID=A0A0A9G892_ARUDO